MKRHVIDNSRVSFKRGITGEIKHSAGYFEYSTSGAGGASSKVTNTATAVAGVAAAATITNNNVINTN